ncbi:hypothetical protein EUX98_g5598 [Antrodiella citrinella]|uniref:Uncharacterized protein n=1 Tax=Antrodiella citrinella TaxID=2447956 RepID=A0A4S4MR71_9APHY|nr:hypothetical protein EUX98_g5598 [Antrodiella citrinella]
MLELAFRHAWRWFGRIIKDHEVYFRATYVVNEIWGTLINSVFGLYLTMRPMGTPGPAMLPAVTRSITLNVWHLDGDSAHLEVTCSPMTLWRDIVHIFCDHYPELCTIPEKTHALWWTQTEELDLYRHVGEYVVDSDGPENIYITPKQPEEKEPKDKPVLYVWVAAQVQTVHVDVTLIPGFAFSAMAPGAAIVPAHLAAGLGERVVWKVVVRNTRRMLDMETGLEQTALSWQIRAKQSSLLGTTIIPASDILNANLNNKNAVVVPVAEIIAYLNSSMKTLGVPVEARTSLLRLWIPTFIRYEYIALRFLPQKLYGQAVFLTVRPKPNLIIRIFMLFRGLSGEDIKSWPLAQKRLQDPVTRWQKEVGVSQADIDRLEDKTIFRILECNGLEVLG